ncbi:hypothetical protein CC117_25885 [Parafrankia colletiae]|uniref:Uncharacterized protein n=1 Tax=Parafrankia colletiae TaxID=573497 RepID=A0A1S1Q9W7_9ACTN|nr:hypothetical protein [Parafrankia colletiae]MCK9903621.1 hypothetical protein [Frankia sp. Cpl3]OHV31643.1 hypothetical protein CC117_25885 [Parafrankia colletiae]
MSAAAATVLLYLADVRAVTDGADPVSGIMWTWTASGPVDADAGRVTPPPTSGSRDDHAGTRTGQGLTAADTTVISQTVAEYGGLSVQELCDVASETQPVRDRTADHELDLQVLRPTPDIGRALAPLRRFLREPTGDVPGPPNEDAVREELDELRPARERANRLLDDS